MIIAVGIASLIFGGVIGMLIGASVTYDAIAPPDYDPTEHGGDPR